MILPSKELIVQRRSTDAYHVGGLQYKPSGLQGFRREVREDSRLYLEVYKY